MATLRTRLASLESAVPNKPWLCLDINGDPTAQEQEQMTEAHMDGREIYIFQTLGDTLGVWLIGADDVVWSDKL
ncbi:hypothetical protein ABXJ76_15580 [Methylobacter sp. G7]|uniref:hypothetical protein n=1 Tax=Methylobacter sp. G7 TaxID=3230117 RepID=UPI003D805D46